MDSVILKQGEITEAYLMGTTLGEGNFAVVRKAKNKQTQEEFAIKIINKEKIGPKQEDLYREIEILSKLDHPNVVKLHEVWEKKNSICLVLDLMSGGELFDRVVEKEFFTEQEAADALFIIAEATGYCHSQNIVHRDLKLENILYKTHDPDSPLIISDFGLSRIYHNADMMFTACGTLGYVAPEIFEGNGYTKAVDIWSIGVILYVLLCGYSPFYSESSDKLIEMIKKGEYEFPPEPWDNLSDAKDLIQKILVVDPSMRIGIPEILSHPWMRANLSRKDAENIPDFNAREEGGERRPQRPEESSR